MAEEKEKKGGGKKAIVGILISALMPILVVVLIASLIFAIIEAIIEVIKAIFAAFFDIITNPFGFINKVVVFANNVLSSFLDLGGFNSQEYDKYKVESRVYISTDRFKEIMSNIDTSLDMDTMGLDDLTLKHMLLTYYTTIHLSSTDLYVELTQDEEKDEVKEAKSYGLFEVEYEKMNDDSEKKPCIHAEGLIDLKGKQDDDDWTYKKMNCFSIEGLKEMYINEYIKNLEEDGSEGDYSASVREELAKCYALEGNTIRMINFNIETVTEIYEQDGKKISESTKTRLINASATEPEWITIDYATGVAEYGMSIEFLTALMQVAQSKEFIFKVMELVEDETNMELRLDNIASVNTEQTVREYTEVNKAKAGNKTLEKTREKLKCTQTKTKTEYKYELTIKNVKAWNSVVDYENELVTELNMYYVDSNGNKVLTKDPTKIVQKAVQDEVEVYKKSVGGNFDNLSAQSAYTILTINADKDTKKVFDENTVTLTLKNQNIKESKNYISSERMMINGTSKVEDKTDNFLKLLIKNNIKQEYESIYGGKCRVGEMLLSGEEMLYELLEGSQSSRGMIEVMRYILMRYKTGAVESDEQFSNIYKLESISDSLTIIGDETDEKIWCTLRSLGYSEYTIAGIMGNIDADSEFETDGNGLGAWEDQREDRLELYAKTKDVEKDDINTQIEYLIGEITTGGGCNRLC